MVTAAVRWYRMFSVKIFPENLSGSTAERHVGVVDRYERKIGH